MRGVVGTASGNAWRIAFHARRRIVRAVRCRLLIVRCIVGHNITGNTAPSDGSAESAGSAERGDRSGDNAPQ